VALTAYIDASGKGDPKRLILAGYIASPEAWNEFSKEWETRLDQAGIAYFKMNEMADRPEIAGYFYRVIEEHDIKAAISCVIRTDELVKVEGSIRYPPYIINARQMQNPYYFGFKAITDLLAQYQRKLRIAEPIDFAFDEESEKVRIPEAWELMKKSSRPDVATLLGKTPLYQDDKKVKPLQAADLFAWWALKWEREGRKEWARNLPFPWGVRRNIPRLAMEFGEKDFLIETATALQKHARNFSELTYALSLMPPNR
jgi:hypothetical protein